MRSFVPGLQLTTPRVEGSKPAPPTNEIRYLRHRPDRAKGSAAQRGRLVRQLVARQRGRIELEYPPANAPELNPVEYVWGY